MATDNSLKIAKIKAILEAGATSVSVDGTSVTYDFEQLRTQLRQLQLADDAQKGQRPVVFSLDLSRAF